jgi:hypothetical protein
MVKSFTFFVACVTIQVDTYSDVDDERYRTIGTSDIGLKKAECDIVSDIGLNFSAITDIRRSNL